MTVIEDSIRIEITEVILTEVITDIITDTVDTRIRIKETRIDTRTVTEVIEIILTGEVITRGGKASQLLNFQYRMRKRERPIKK